MACQWQLFKRVTATQIMFIQPKLTHNPDQHARPRGTHKQTGDNARGLGGISQRNCTTNADFLPHRRSQNSGARQCRDRPAVKPPRQWRHAAGQRPDLPAAITPGRHIGRLRRASATPTRQGQRRRSSITRGGPPGHPRPRRRLHALWLLPGLGAPKSRRPLGWKNCGRQ